MPKKDETKKDAVPFADEDSSEEEEQTTPDENAETQDDEGQDGDHSAEDDAADESEEESPVDPEQEKPKRTSPNATAKKGSAKKTASKKAAPKKQTSNADVGIEYQKMSRDMKKHLDAQPRVQFMIPLAPNEKAGAWESVQINGYRMVIKKGTMVTIPQQVAQILADHYQIQMEAGKEHLIRNKDQDVEEALTE